MANIAKATKVREMGRAVRLALLLSATLLLIGLTIAPQAKSKEQHSPSWWLQIAESTGEPLVSVPMPVGAGWCLAWNHSVEGFEVHDCYRNHAGRMVLERSNLPDFAAGLDHIPGRGRQISDGQGGYWIEDINEPVPDNRYQLRVGSADVNHRLISHGEPGLSQLLEDAERAGCNVLAPRPEDGTDTVISLSDLAANQGVTVQLVASTSCSSDAPEGAATVRLSS